jgi:hypothetical protein
VTDWRKSGQISYDKWAEVVDHYDSPLRYEGKAAYQAAGALSALALAMLIRESQVGTDFNLNRPENHNALNLRPPSGDGYLAFDSWTAGIRAWYNRITSPTYRAGIYAKTVSIADLISVYAPPNDNNNTADYIATVEALIAGWHSATPSGEPPMVNDLNFRVDLIPEGNSNRPGFLLNTDDRLIGITQHTTGNTNPSADAEMHVRFTHEGGGSDNVSFHFVVDDKIAVQLLPLYEGAYHAADGCDNRATDIGCFDTVAIELCVNSGANWARAKDNLAKLYAMLWNGDKRLAGIDRVTVQNGRVYTHQQVSDTNKYCPQQILDEGSLPVIIAQGKQYAANGSGITPADEYAKPIVPPWLANDDGISIETINGVKVYPVHLTYTAVKDTPRKQATGKNNAKIGPDIKKGEVFSAGRAYRSGSVTYVLTDYGTRVTARDLLPKVAISVNGTVSVRYE